MIRPVARVVVLLVTAFVPLLALSLPAGACSCVRHGASTLRDEVAAAELAFKGEVVAELGNGNHRVRVDEVYQGSVPALVEVWAPDDPRNSCSVPLGLDPIVYVGENDLRVEFCDATLVGAGAREADTGDLPRRPPEPAATTPTPGPRAGDDRPGLVPVAAVWTLGGVGAAALVAVLWAVRARRLSDGGPPAT